MAKGVRSLCVFRSSLRLHSNITITLDQAMNVLLVDDEPNIVKTIAISLSAMDLQVESFVHPRQALEYARSSPKFDIAFLDLKMYPMDGIELMEELLRIMPKLRFGRASCRERV